MKVSTETIVTGIWFDKGSATADWFRAFEAYGHAMASAAALEFLLALSLLKQRVREQNMLRQAQLPINDLLRHGDRLRKLSLPKLISQCKRTFNLSRGLLEGLELRKRARDHLAHNFWDSNIGLFHSEKGIDLLVESCTFECWHFKNLAADFESEIGFDVMDFVHITRQNNDELEQGFDQMLNEFR